MSVKLINVIIGASAMLASCVLMPGYSTPAGQVITLSFIQDGATTRQEVLMKMGTPSARYENDRILTYRLQFDDKGNCLVVQQSNYWVDGPAYDWWTPNTQSLVLIFDSDGKLKIHKLVKVK